MNSEIKKDTNEEIKIKNQNETENSVPEAILPDLTLDIPEFPLKCRKIRLILNKVSEENFEKLVIDLVTSFDYNLKLLKELVRLIFERATSKNFSELYSLLCYSFHTQIKFHNHSVYKAFKSCLNEKCAGMLSLSDNSLLAYSTFVCLLFKKKLIKSTVIYQFLDQSLSTTASEIQLESVCSVLKQSSPYLVHTNYERIERVFDYLISLNFETYSKKIQFLVLDIIEKKELLLTPVALSQSCLGTPYKDTKSAIKNAGKGVKFSNVHEFQPVQSKQTKRILTQGVSEEVKIALKESVRDFMAGKKQIENCKEIFRNNHKKVRQLINQIFKYALTSYNREPEFIRICDLIMALSQEIENHQVIETGLTNTVEAIHDIKLDSPLAPQHLIFIINYLHQIGIIQNPNTLIQHINT